MGNSIKRESSQKDYNNYKKLRRKDHEHDKNLSFVKSLDYTAVKEDSALTPEELEELRMYREMDGNGDFDSFNKSPIYEDKGEDVEQIILTSLYVFRR